MTGVSRGWLGLSATLAGVLAAACGNDSGAPSPASSAGGSAGSNGLSGTAGVSMAGASPGAGGSANGGAPGAGGSPMSATEACLEYGLAQFMRQQECGVRAFEPTQAAATDLSACPDLFLSDGSARTVENLLACAEEWRALPCSEASAFHVPACATAGTRAAGEPCVFGSQCQSRRCIEPNPCGHCATRVGPGEACEDADSACDVGYYCDGVCVAQEPAPEFKPLPPPAELGEPCSDREGVRCTGEGFCMYTDGQGRCAPRVPIGGSCNPPYSYCVAEAYCDPTDHCVVLPERGEPCGPRSEGSSGGSCSAGLQCNLDTVTCEFPPNRVPCEEGGPSCPMGSICCEPPDCPVRACKVFGLPGEACSADVLCHPGTQCVAGVCEPIDSQGLFEAACGP